MDKHEAYNLTQSMIDYFTELLHFEHPEDIRFDIIDSPDPVSNVLTNPTHMVYDIQINIYDQQEDIAHHITHELAHVFLGEYAEMFHQLFGYTGEQTTEFKVFDRANERTAMRFGRMMLEMWNLKEELEKMNEPRPENN